MNTKMVSESHGYTMSTIEEGVDATLRLRDLVGPSGWAALSARGNQMIRYAD